ncbi:MAG: nucleotide exchange factor GrpE [Deltaproteobacteria bacterium]|nr:nucleotide exchange factor GrpE [Deltaproteobacteria bacterium]
MVAKMKKDTVEISGGLSRKAGEPKATAGEPEVEVPAKKDQVEELMVKLQEAEEKAAENYDKYVRAVAELDNYRKRAAREKADAIQYGNENLLRDILPLVDGMDRALEHACNSEDFDAFRKGLKLLQGQLMGCLQKHGVEMIDTAGKDFDPHIHEAMMQVESAQHEDSQVVGEFEKGYLLNGRLLRPAKVSVCKRPSMGGDRENNCEEAKNN